MDQSNEVDDGFISVNQTVIDEALLQHIAYLLGVVGGAETLRKLSMDDVDALVRNCHRTKKRTIAKAILSLVTRALVSKPLYTMLAGVLWRSLLRFGSNGMMI